ncbi:MAG TPA: thiamine phosphate synthase [Planctomycetota bacterium]|nr:thiamine phosphate synthase [Planctomycetota bacterium]
MTRDALRVLDAEGNRAAEGLRALEEVARFVLDDALTAAALKDLRHRLRAALPPVAVAQRDTAGDVGVGVRADDEMQRANLVALVRANAARVQEATRCAEEFAKLAGVPAYAHACAATRYAVYQLELKLLARLPAWRLWAVRLYALIDTALTDRPVEVAAAVARGGAGAVQLRAKGLGARAYRELGARVADACRAHDALFVVNDHAAVARILGADGLHVGQDDLRVADARAVTGALCAIGVSTHERAQVAQAIADGADYLGCGPMYATVTKAHEPARGPELLACVRELCAARVPTYAIGGLDLARVRALRPRIPHGVAIAGALCRAADPERAAAELRDLFEDDDRLLAGAAP